MLLLKEGHKSIFETFIFIKMLSELAYIYNFYHRKMSNIKETRKGELSTSYKIVSKVERNKKK